MEFAPTGLGDARLSRRLVQIGGALAQCPSGTLPQAFPEWADLKAAYRFFSNEKVSYEKIITPHWQQTRARCTEPGEYLLIEDTTILDYSSHEACAGLGRVGNGFNQGLMLHTTLALRVIAWNLHPCPQVTVAGVLAQQSWTRQGPTRRERNERWNQQLKRQRESERWGQALASLPARPREVSWIYVADREADFYEAFERCQAAKIDCIIRSIHRHRTTQEDGPLVEVVGQAPLLGCFELELRARQGQPARSAQIEVRAATVTLLRVWRPGGDRPALVLKAVEAREVGAPAKQRPVHWVLLTTLPVESFVQARRVVGRYASRWVVEEYHKALKTGANVQKSQLESITRLQALLAVMAVVAVRLLNTKLLARTEPRHGVDEHAFGREPLQVLEAHFGKPSRGWTYATLLVAIARLGGFLARRHDGDPGWITIWRGWQRLTTMTAGFVAMQHNPARRCG